MREPKLCMLLDPKLWCEVWHNPIQLGRPPGLLIIIIIVFIKPMLVLQGLPDAAARPLQEQDQFGVLLLAAFPSVSFLDISLIITLSMLTLDKLSHFRGNLDCH